jgi:hypothetical protein
MVANVLYDGYDSPESLAGDTRLPVELRTKELESWAADLMARLKASDESMTSPDPGKTSELLRRVHACVQSLAEARRGQAR